MCNHHEPHLCETCMEYNQGYYKEYGDAYCDACDNLVMMIDEALDRIIELNRTVEELEIKLAEYTYNGEDFYE